MRWSVGQAASCLLIFWLACGCALSLLFLVVVCFCSSWCVAFVVLSLISFRKRVWLVASTRNQVEPVSQTPCACVALPWEPTLSTLLTEADGQCGPSDYWGKEPTTLHQNLDVGSVGWVSAAGVVVGRSSVPDFSVGARRSKKRALFFKLVAFIFLGGRCLFEAFAFWFLRCLLFVVVLFSIGRVVLHRSAST